MNNTKMSLHQVFRFLFFASVLHFVTAPNAVAASTSAFHLFDPDRGKTPPPPKAEPVQEQQKPAPKQTRPRNKRKPEKHYTLRGTSRFGNRFTAILQSPDRAGTTVAVAWTPGTQVSLPGGDGYRLVHVSGRKAQLLYPEDKPCTMSDSRQGVTCSDDGRIGTLTLVSRAPTRPAKVEKKTKPVPKTAVKKGNNGQQADAGNPFLKALNRSKKGAAGEAGSEDLQKKREEARKKRAEKYKNFKPKRIKDEDVPEGMRVIRTPFGDRLVPKKN